MEFNTIKTKQCIPLQNIISMSYLNYWFYYWVDAIEIKEAILAGVISLVWYTETKFWNWFSVKQVMIFGTQMNIVIEHFSINNMMYTRVYISNIFDLREFCVGWCK